MSNSYEIPTIASLAELLRMIFGDELMANACESPNLEGQYAAVFVGDDDNLAALCVCDNKFVAYSGAALSMIPADVAADMISGNAVTDAMVANFYEVMNICSKLMMSDTSAHLRLKKVLSPGEAADTISSLSEGQSHSFAVDIPNYGNGALTFLLAA